MRTYTIRWSRIKSNSLIYIRDHRILPQVLFVCTSGKGGEGVEGSENMKLEEKPEENEQGGRGLG